MIKIRKENISILPDDIIDNISDLSRGGIKTDSTIVNKVIDNLRNISARFSKHFDNVLVLRKKLEESMGVVDSFGKDARSISRTLENIKDPEQVEIATKTENVEKFVDHSKQLKN